VRKTGADVNEVARAIGMDSRIGSKFQSLVLRFFQKRHFKFGILQNPWFE
jgi:hypothetical protein